MPIIEAPSTEFQCPSWYLEALVDGTGGTQSIGHSLQLLTQAPRSTVLATYLGSEPNPFQIIDSPNFATYTRSAPQVSLRLRRQTQDGKADTYVDISVTPQLHLGIALQTEQAEKSVYELRRDSGQKPYPNFDQSILELLQKQKGNFVKSLWRDSSVQLVSSGAGNQDCRLSCSPAWETPEDDPSKLRTDLIQLEQNFWAKNGDYASSAREILSTGRSHQISWRPFIIAIEAGFKARKASTAPYRDIPSTMSGTMSGPQELEFQIPTEEAIELPWLPTTVTCQLGASLDFQ